MNAYDWLLFRDRSLLRRAARRAIGIVRSRAPGLADRFSPIKRRLEGRLPRQRAGVAFERCGAAAHATEDPVLTDARRRLAAAAPIDPGLLDEVRQGPLSSLRVLHVVGGLAAGGAERQVVATVVGLRGRGAKECELLVTDHLGDPQGAYRRRLDAAGVEPLLAGRRADPRFMQRLRSEPSLLLAAQAIPPLLRPRCADLFGEFVVRRPHLVHCWLDHTSIWGGVAAVLAGVPAVVLSARSVAPTNFPPLFEPWLEPWYQALLARPGVVLVNNSAAGADDYACWLGIDRSRIAVILNGIDFEAMALPPAEEIDAFRAAVGAKAGPDPDPILTGILRLGEEKRPEVFLQVAQELTRRLPRLRVAMVGGGPLESRIRARAAAGPGADRIHLLGPRHDVPAILSASSLLLLTSRQEGTPNVLLEAQHFGCPVVTTAAGGAVDAVLDGVTGAIRPVDDVPGLVEACGAILSDDSHRRRLGEAGRRFVRERFGLERMLDETMGLHRRALAETRCSGA